MDYIKEKGFIHQDAGFQLTFKNGYSLSVKWSPFHYCDNNDYRATHHESNTCEIACFNRRNDKFVPLAEHDDVVGWVTPDDLAKYISEVSNWPDAREDGMYDKLLTLKQQ